MRSTWLPPNWETKRLPAESKAMSSGCSSWTAAAPVADVALAAVPVMHAKTTSPAVVTAVAIRPPPCRNIGSSFVRGGSPRHRFMTRRTPDTLRPARSGSRFLGVVRDVHEGRTTVIDEGQGSSAERFEELYLRYAPAGFRLAFL